MTTLLMNTAVADPYVTLIHKDQSAIQTITADRTIGQQLLRAVDTLCQQLGCTKNDIVRIATHIGPAQGSLMSLRTGCITATSLAQALSCDLVAVQGENQDKLLQQAATVQATTVLKPVYK